jgi:hypothetical protein
MYLKVFYYYILIMVNYAESKIYKIVGSGLTYYGSTCQPTLAKRLAAHKCDYKRYKDGKNHCVIKSFDIFELGEYTIVLVEKYPCTSKDELHARERYYIENNECVNKNIPNRTDAEYYQANKECIKAKVSKYREINKIAINLKRVEVRLCECGSKYTFSNYNRHAKSNMHKAYEARNISDSA